MPRKPTGGPPGRPAHADVYRSVLVNLTADQLAALDNIVKRGRMPRNILIREAVDDLIEKYREVLEADDGGGVLVLPRPPGRSGKGRAKA
jgi:hypothetical protein